MPGEKSFKIRLNKLKLVNFKCFDEIELEFPRPFHEKDLDVFVMGSQNGLGKTSILEACALLFLCLMLDKWELEHALNRLRRTERFLSITDYFIKSGKSNSTIEGHFEFNDKEYPVKFKIKEGNFVCCMKENSLIHENLFWKKDFHRMRHYLEEFAETFLLSIIPVSDDPFILPPFIYFNSNRKIKVGNPRFSDISEYSRYPEFYIKKLRFFEERGPSVIDSFKAEIIRILMGKGGIFEDFDMEDIEKTQKFLNSLCKEYAGGTIEKLRPGAGESLELRITPTEGGESIPFDGLSSGQKEIISTLFLIWKNTKDQSGIILIDEPELHLNLEWQHKFIRTLEKLLPQNQYILATHSKEVFASVEPEYRAIIRPDNYDLSEDEALG